MAQTEKRAAKRNKGRNIDIYKEGYYYIRDHNRPHITVCIINSDLGIGRGIAICSRLDQPCKKTGRKIARDRAIHAIISHQSSLPMRSNIGYADFVSYALEPSDYKYDFKSRFDPMLTALEGKIVYGNSIDSMPIINHLQVAAA